ncbi:toxic anion resistance protein [Clostridium guangxiense]|uniref:toxic anion resistance protein n=1 Tax=Clostridium guangxiense TaxID=1662055 RepID=UPI001E352F7D|nr:toxic anion resistance protein [Clostridium guangxiense]MCD2346618.1 toxic anion resistance protein [Clostridium guangxiense]
MRFKEENSVYNNAVPENNEIPNNTKREMEEKLENIKKELKNSPEVIQISKKLDVSNINAIMEFGSEPASEISKFSDKILNTMKVSSVENSGALLKELTVIMKRFDKEELEEKPESFFSRIFNSSKKTIQSILSKYQSLGGEIDKIYSRITSYKSEIEKTNKMLEEMFSQNFNYYTELEKYCAACELAINEIQNEDLPYYEEKAASGTPDDNLKLQEIKYSLEMLNQRLYDLNMAKVVSLQTAPQIRTIQKGNYKLIGKIHSAFIVTIPVFKNGLIQAVTLKRQKLVAKSMEALDNATNELLLKNAQNLKDQSIDIAKLTGAPSIKIETLENTWKIIMDGINETEKIEEENKKLRKEGMEKLNKLQVEYMEKVNK